MKQSSRQQRTHKFYLNLGELGKFEPVVSHQAMLKVLYDLFPDYDQLSYEEKRSAWRESRNKAYQALKRGYEKKYSKQSQTRFSRIDVYQSKEYQNV